MQQNEETELEAGIGRDQEMRLLIEPGRLTGGLEVSLASFTA